MLSFWRRLCRTDEQWSFSLWYLNGHLNSWAYMEWKLLRIQSGSNLGGAITLALLCMSGPTNDHATLPLLTHSSALKMVITHCSVVQGNFGCSATHSACSWSLSFPFSLYPLGTPGAHGGVSHGEPDKVQTSKSMWNLSFHSACFSIPPLK